MNQIMQLTELNEETSVLQIYGEISKKSFWTKVFEKETGVQDDSTSAMEFTELMSKVTTPNLEVRINSMGGSVSEGLAIYNALCDFDGHVTTIVDGFACSAASVIFMAGKKRVVPESSLLMIHNAWSHASGDSNALRKAAEDLEKITQPSVNIFVSKTNLSETEVKEKMDHETWIVAQEAYDWGFATSIERNEAKQSLSDSYLRKIILENKELKSSLSLIDNNVEHDFNEKSSQWDGFFN